MTGKKRIGSALISVYHKEGLEPIIRKLHELKVTLYSTGGTYEAIRALGVPVKSVESLTGYPSILGGRVKTLHPKVFGGILARRLDGKDRANLEKYQIPEIDLVMVDLYPFEETLQSTEDESEIIEKIDIGGIALIRAAAKNYQDTLVVSHRGQYQDLLRMLEEEDGFTGLEQRKAFARDAFGVSSHYDTAIFHYFNREDTAHALKVSLHEARELRYGENPHQQGVFFGNLEEAFEQLHGKAISYNNLVDIDAAVRVIAEFDHPAVAILKHTNACGLAERDSLSEAWEAALAGDPVSAFGGIIIVNRPMDEVTAEGINKLFVEVVIAPDFEPEALSLLRGKKNRILLRQKQFTFGTSQYRSLLNGAVWQELDLKTETEADFQVVTQRIPEKEEITDLVFGNKAVKHLKSNAIALAKGKQLIGIGTGQTSRVDALKQAIAKASHFKFDLRGAIMASDAFFPFPDCVEIAHEAGIRAVIQPGGSIRDQASIDFCNAHEMAMVFTGTRHFKH